MTPPPLPPHERAWRHPSELPAPPHEPPTRGGRVLIIATAALGLSFVGALAVRMTPGTTGHRDALGAVTSSSLLGSIGTDSFVGLGAGRSTSRLLTELLTATLSSISSTADDDLPATSPLTEPVVRLAVVTPISDDGLGLTTEAAVAGRTGRIEAMLPTGATVTAELVTARDGVAIVQLADAAGVGPATLAGTRRGGKDLTVMAYGDQFEVGEGGAGLQSLDVPEAAPVFDADGKLIALCTIGPDGVAMLPVDTIPDVEPEPPPPAESTEPATSVVVTTEPTVTTTGSSTPNASSQPPTTDRAAATTTPATSEPAAPESSMPDTSEPVDSSIPASTDAT